MRNYSSILVVVGSLCLLTTLVLAWCVVGVRTAAFMKKLFPSYQNLLKAHIDYLLMTGLLMIFFLLFTHFNMSPSPFVVLPMCAGSLLNPAGFLALAKYGSLFCGALLLSMAAFFFGGAGFFSIILFLIILAIGAFILR